MSGPASPSGRSSSSPTSLPASAVPAPPGAVAAATADAQPLNDVATADGSSAGPAARPVTPAVDATAQPSTTVPNGEPVVSEPTTAPPQPAVPDTAVPDTAAPTTAVPAAVVPATRAPDEPLEQWVGRQALARISYPWASALPGWRIDFLPGKPGYLGGTLTYEHRIEIYVRDSQSVEEIAFTLAHELGHAVDLTYLTDDERQTWKSVRGIAGGTPWWAGSGVSDYSSGSGDWAEAFAVWQVGGPSESRIADQPSPAQLDVLAALAAG